jgi:hypothetical protein
MYGEIIAAIQSTKALGELLKATTSLANHNDLMSAVSEVNSKLMDATAVALASQEAQSRYLARIRELETELNKVAGWEAQAVRYELRELSLGKFAYALRPEELAKGEPHHLLCANCFVKHQKALLQLNAHNEMGQWYDCHNCKSTLHTMQSVRPDGTSWPIS